MFCILPASTFLSRCPTPLPADGIVHAASLATVNDDPFISFRYAQQLVVGNGLVYNPGERLEGYTNFLWTILIAGGQTFLVTLLFCISSRRTGVWIFISARCRNSSTNTLRLWRRNAPGMMRPISPGSGSIISGITTTGRGKWPFAAIWKCIPAPGRWDELPPFGSFRLPSGWPPSPV